MSSLPKCLQNPGLRQVKLDSGRTVVTEKLGEQHYLVWSDGNPLTEIEQVPKDSGRWYWAGNTVAFQYAKTMRNAIQAGILRNVRCAAPPPWSKKACDAITKRNATLA